MSAAFGLLCTLNTTTFLLGLAAPLPIILYPLAKRLQLNKDIKVKIIYRGVGLIRTVLIRTIGLIRTVFQKKNL